MTQFHPLRDGLGRRVPILRPNQPTLAETWSDPNRGATFVPRSPVPAAIGGVPVRKWKGAPSNCAGWEALASEADFDEPHYLPLRELHPASGAIVVEEDGRIWIVSPSNQFAGYENTFPKGTIKGKHELSLRANAIKEVFEESGLLVQLTGFLCDSVRTQSYTRYYLGHRVEGSPAEMGWESQAVHLIPPAEIATWVNHHNDAPILQALTDAGFLVTGSS